MYSWNVKLLNRYTCTYGHLIPSIDSHWIYPSNYEGMAIKLHHLYIQNSYSHVHVAHMYNAYFVFCFNTVQIGITCFIVTAGLQSLSSSKIDKHTVPDGYTLGWNMGGSNLPFEISKNQLNYYSHTIIDSHLGGEVG